MVFGLAAAAVEILVKRAGADAGDVGDDKARVGALGAGLDAGDDALDAAPTRRAIEELLVAPKLAVRGTAGVSGRGAVLQRDDACAQCAAGGQAENELQALGAAEIQHFRRAIMM